MLLRISMALLLGILSLPLSFVEGQVLTVSESEKLSSNFLNYRVLGKNTSGVLIYKHKREREMIEIYDQNMALIRRKTLESSLQPVESVNVLLVEDGSVLHFYVHKTKRVHYLFAQAMDEGLLDKNPPQLLDSVDRREDGNWDEFMIRLSEDRSQVLVFRQSLKGAQSTGVLMRLFDTELRERWLDELSFDDIEKDMVLSDAFISNGGDVCIVQIRDLSKLRPESFPHAIIHMRPADFGVFRKLAMTESPEGRIREMAFSWDSRNNRIIGAGFFAESNRSFSSGLYFISASASGEWVARQFTPFHPDFIKSLSTRTSRKRDEIPVYNIQEIVARSDGGALLVAEYIHETSESYEYTDYDPYYGGYRTSTRYINYHEYEDIMLLMLEPDGMLAWEEIIRKKQVSREDRGRNSSFAMLNAHRQLFFIFNEDISYNTNVLQYNMDTRGKVNRSSMFNANSKELMLVPRRARQISGNEIVIPSIYKNNLAFVKLSY